MSTESCAAVVIATRNRRDDLRTALQSTFMQTADLEVIVIDDGSTDGTTEMVTLEFPSARLVRHDRSTGYIVARNEGARLAQSSIIISIDDDAAFSSKDVVASTVEEFNHPAIGAVAIPYVDVNRDTVERQRTPDPYGVFVTDRYIGTAHAVRRDIFLSLGGYREFYFHQGEESDLCFRMLSAGFFVRLGNSERIDHFESPKRDTYRMDVYGRRNDILFVWLNVPWRCLPLHLASLTVKGIWFGLRVGRPLRMIRGLMMGYAAAFHYRHQRSPVSLGTYRLYRRLRKARGIPLDECERQSSSTCPSST